MKASTNQIALKNGLSTVTRFVSPRSTLPVLANVLMAWTMDGRIKLACTNLEQGAVTWITGAVESEGAITVPAKLMGELVSTLSGEISLSINTNTQTLTVKCGASSTEIKGIDAAEFPPMPEVSLTDAYPVKGAEIKRVIEQVSFAASTDEARPVLQGVQVGLSEWTAAFVATDGFRVSVRKLMLEKRVEKPVSLIIPARALNELARIVQAEDVVSIAIPAGRGSVTFATESVQLTSQLIDGNFPDYKVIVPRSFKAHTKVSTAGLLKAVRQAEIIARNGNGVVRLELIHRNDGGVPSVIVTANSEETGANEGEVLAESVDGVDEMQIAFNVRFLREVLEVVGTQQIELATNDGKSPALINPVGDDQYKHVLMPMNLG